MSAAATAAAAITSETYVEADDCKPTISQSRHAHVPACTHGESDRYM